MSDADDRPIAHFGRSVDDDEDRHTAGPCDPLPTGSRAAGTRGESEHV